jgi:hypothetical protein
MKFHYGIVLGLIAAALAGCNWPPQPRTPVNLPPPIEIAQVHSLAELKAQPLISVAGNWQVRLGWADSGPDGGPWKLVYCYGEWVGRDWNPIIPTLSRGEAVTVGPVQVVVTDPATHAKAGKPQVGPGWFLGGFYGPVGVFCTSVPTAWKGRYRISIFDASGRLVAETTLDIDEPQPCYWQELADMIRDDSPLGLQGAVAIDPAAVRPSFESIRPVWCPANDIDEQVAEAAAGLPGQVPTAPFWMGRYMWSGPGRDNEPATGLSLALRGKNLVVRSRGDIFLAPDINLAARWWVGDQAVPATLSRMFVLDAMTRMPESGTEMRVGLRLPAMLGELKAGDTVSLQVLYSPGHIERILKDRSQGVIRALRTVSSLPNVPFLSNRLEFKVESWMLVGREAM